MFSALIKPMNVTVLKPFVQCEFRIKYNHRYYEVLTTDFYLFTNSALVFRPLSESPRHRSQKRSSSTFNDAGFLLPREDPGISLSSKLMSSMTVQIGKLQEKYREVGLTGLDFM